MARRKFNYQPRTRKSSNNSEKQNRIVEHTIKNIERIEETDIIKIVTTNGTRCSIVAENAWTDSWRALWNGLQEGDKVEIKSHAGKIISCTAKVTKNSYMVTDFQKNSEEVIITLKDAEKEMQVKITELDIEEGKITCEDVWYETLNWSDISYLGYMAGTNIDIFFISERIVFIRFSISII